MENTNQDRKKIAFSGIQSTGSFTLGNYLGALRNWVKIQDECDGVFCVVDEHAITVRQDPTTLRKKTLEAFAMIMACGIDIDKSILFIQSHVPAHAQAAWVLNCYTQFGELSRMTQFKDKSAKHAENINAGLFTYPSLMAADILLYQTDVVPVGEDQKQHVELARDIAQRFNGLYGDVFTIPEPIIPKVGARIMSLQEPKKKMSKSDENINAFVTLSDSNDDIMRKFKRAITDSDSCVKYGKDKDGVNNLMTIMSAVTGKTFAEIENEFEGKGYGDFKIAVGESVIAEIAPVRDEYLRLLADKEYLEQCYRKGAEKASKLADRTLAKMYKKVGFVAK
ncbi:MAG: tryptophan--tRNA ligase [Oscillospiraceae bacterium]